MILNEEGKREFLQSNFHQYFDIILQADITENDVTQFVNYTLPLTYIDTLYDLEGLKPFFNDDFTNVIFTNEDDSVIFRYEFYQGIYFIRLQPFSKKIRMHLIPKKYDGSENHTLSSILIFKDQDVSINDSNFSHTNQYDRDANGSPINLYYNQANRQSSNGFYKFNIKDKAKYFTNLQINMGYAYNDSNPTYNEENPYDMDIIHYTGVIDESDYTGAILNPSDFTEWNQSLMDANYDNVSTFTNTSKLQTISNGAIQWPTDGIPYDDGEENHILGFDNPHTVGVLYNKVIKYFNDDIYIEENGKYLNQSWKER